MIKKLLFLCLFITTYEVVAQGDESEIIHQKIESFFKDFHQRDSIQLKTYFDQTAELQSVIELKDGASKVVKETISKFVTSIGSIPDSIKFEERISKATINRSDKMAHAFVPYQFYINNQLSHCGVNSFIFVKVNKKWLISNIIDTRRRTDCQ